MHCYSHFPCNLAAVTYLSCLISPPVYSHLPQLSVDFSQVSCLTAEGVGHGHVLAVTVGGQTSNVFPANISYSSPNVASC